MITATRRIQFCSGHRVFGHEGHCRNMHGHNYVAFLTAAANSRELDGVGRVVDFSVLKERVGGWIDEKWDHGFIAWVGDAEAVEAVRSVGGSKLFQLPNNPTAENMADYLLRWVGPLVLAGSGVELVKVVLWETENCHAEVTL
ncbi:COG0720 6-pyruvoyl-tetrahydropterin synthase [uncultured Caudovirales phage]|uniref:COG0720 6-pyruvoyl-tetrahydropterin synthase n=1 Tax=uncultured Caudovirales phage TaxID=2100421 RepID=A0A6J5T2Q5_9CAUD|nr:COG0720 6-pyruvoyl-tetrahydropterin synthase [uncultured Caudovirales phage]CAB4180538.1 COG0720 6-pyruvoyl-tetrahydropterin synthase [uncultured Caudovirales phage]CAB4190731.1 COG0720 6-pyruvoyl-tetrahydropterin synthase [uncultured Caudovirales phage]CAB4221859.1 COG0720 6-pyruvoyl-tetrahydropterin synthase [uncultured Caudovirales phage]